MTFLNLYPNKCCLILYNDGYLTHRHSGPHIVHIILKQDACTGVHSACRREEMCTTPSTAQAGANAGISWYYGGEGGGIDLQI